MERDLTVLRGEPFASALQELVDFLSQRRRVFLLGAGCSRCAGLPLTGELTELVLKEKSPGVEARKILDAVCARYKRDEPVATIEDYMSEIVDYLALSQRRHARGAEDATVKIKGDKFGADVLASALKQIQGAVASVIRDRPSRVETHRAFVKAVHGTLEAGKANQGRCVDYVVLNYDTLIEDALCLERIPMSDGFMGGVTAWWAPEVYGLDGYRARVVKVHGSIDWWQLEDEDFPRRIRDRVEDLPKSKHALIWPCATKYREAQRDPFALMLGRFREALRAHGEEQCVLTVCGYSFSDAHINAELEQALRDERRAITLIVLTGAEALPEPLQRWCDDNAITDQVRVYGARVFRHGPQVIEGTEDLPWWRFEELTRLLGGSR